MSQDHHGYAAHRSDGPPAPNGQPPAGWHGVEPDTSERLYTSDEFAAYSDARLREAEAAAPSPHGDPLTDPLPGQATQVRQPEPDATHPPQAPPSPVSDPAHAWPPAGTAGEAPGHAGGLSEPLASAEPAPASPQPVAPPATAGHAAEPQPGAESQPETEGEGVRRFMTATDFLDRRSEQVEIGPAQWGWRGKVRRWSGGLVAPKMGRAELSYEQNRRSIQRDFDGPRTIAFLNPKGGAAKTTGVLAAGYTFGTVRGGGVVAWDNNETRGTLGIRGTRSTHRNTTRELLEDLEKFSDVYQARIGDLGAFVRSQGDAHFDVLASDERPDVTGMIRAQDFTAVHQLLERFYRLILIDTGNNMRAENWLAAAEAADLLVVTSTVREDTGYSGLWMLDALQDAGYQNLKHKTVTVLSDPSSHVDQQLAHDLTQVYEQRTKHVFRVPYDPVLVAGSVVPYAQLSEGTRSAWLSACAGMAGLL
jgi:MinD-like ATPase involved in chromosome partitioning or flagellar assembly